MKFCSFEIMDSVLSYVITNTEKRAVENLLVNGHRLDKRDFREPRPMKVSLSEGSSIVHLGKTIVSCHTTYTEEIPDENRPNEGLFSLSLATPYRIDSQFRIEVLRSIKAAFIKTKALDLESLVIKIGISCYHLNSEIVILDNDGGLIDACTASLAMSLLSLHIPGSRGPRPICLHHLPLSVTFFVYTPEIIVVDPTLLEASITNPCFIQTSKPASITIFANANGYVISLRASLLQIEERVSGLDVRDIWVRCLSNI